jgi:tetrahydromethanopterin S-methyltransferase subunit G
LRARLVGPVAASCVDDGVPSTGMSVSRLVGRSVGRSIGWLVSQLVGWSV